MNSVYSAGECARVGAMAGGRRQWLVALIWAALGSVLADSWTTYQEQPCCRPVTHHRVRHHRGLLIIPVALLKDLLSIIKNLFELKI